MLTDVDTVKAMLGITTTTQDAQITALLPAADTCAKNYMQRQIEKNTYTQYLSGNNRQEIVLPETPVLSVTSLQVNNSGYFGQNASFPFDSSTTLTEGTEWVLDRDQPDGSSKSGILYRIGTTWPIMYQLNSLNQLTPYQGPAWGNIKVVYVGGYAEVPSDIQYAVSAIVMFMIRTGKFGGMMLASEKLGDYAYAMIMNPLYLSQVGSILEILGRYREIGW